MPTTSERITSSLTSITVDTVGLSVVLGYLVVDEGDNVGSDGGFEDSREADGGVCPLVLLAVDGDQGAGCRKGLKDSTK